MQAWAMGLGSVSEEEGHEDEEAKGRECVEAEGDRAPFSASFSAADHAASSTSTLARLVAFWADAAGVRTALSFVVEAISGSAEPAVPSSTSLWAAAPLSASPLPRFERVIGVDVIIYLHNIFQKYTCVSHACA
jgi:hypothetical protein